MRAEKRTKNRQKQAVTKSGTKNTKKAMKGREKMVKQSRKNWIKKGKLPKKQNKRQENIHKRKASIPI